MTDWDNAYLTKLLDRGMEEEQPYDDDGYGLTYLVAACVVIIVLLIATYLWFMLEP